MQFKAVPDSAIKLPRISFRTSELFNALHEPASPPPPTSASLGLGGGVPMHSRVRRGIRVVAIHPRSSFLVCGFKFRGKRVPISKSKLRSRFLASTTPKRTLQAYCRLEIHNE
ncbi:hypothetical protein KSP39_PZI005597 [Platanthera zijinensis]|uniref:Uncharacterized protein n=1 Tax=Platanthera zijinensis TaxID=2320716 RepID=A0AAP0BV77_9ASPA